MSLPVTISGLSVACPIVGPFKSSAGNYYFFGRDNSVATTLQAYKTNDPTISWSSIATKTGFSTALLWLNGDQHDDVIHLVVVDGTSGTSVNIKYQTFDMSSDSFVTSETVASGIDNRLNSTAAADYAAIVFGTTNNQPVVFFNGTRGLANAQYYGRVYFSNRTGTNTWAAATAVDSSPSDRDSICGCAIMGGSGYIHFCWSYSNVIYQRALNSSNALQTQTNSGNAGTPNQGVYLASSNTCVVSTHDPSGRITYFTSGAAPDINYTTSVGLQDYPNWIFADSNADKFVCLFVYSTTELDKNISTDNTGGSWGSRASIMTSTAFNTSFTAGSLNGRIYTRGSGPVVSRVMPFVINDNGTWKYNEYTVAAQGSLGSPIQSEPIQSGVPADFTLEAGSFGARIIEDVTTNVTDRVFDLSSYTTAGDCTWRPSGVGAVSDCEVLTLVKIAGATSGGTKYLIAGARMQTGAFSGYGVYLESNGTSGGNYVQVCRITTGSISSPTSISFTWTNNTWYYCRLNVSGNTLKAKLWALGNAEPGSWNIQSGWTDNNYATGYSGVLFNSALQKYAAISLGVGTTAPMPAMAGSAKFLGVGAFDAKTGYNAQWHNQIPLYPIQSGLPSVWTIRNGSGAWAIEADSTALNTSDRAIVGTTQNDDNAPFIATYDVAGIQDNDAEVLGLVKFTGTLVNGQQYQFLGLRLPNSSADGYGAYIQTSSTAITTVGLARFNPLSVFTSFGVTLDLNAWYWVRLRLAGTHLYLKLWTKGTAEPGSWNLDFDAGSFALSSGRPGIIFSRNALKPHFANFSVGNGSFSAPLDNASGASAISAKFNGAGSLKANATLINHVEVINQQRFSGSGFLAARATKISDFQAGALFTGRGSLNARGRATDEWNIQTDEGINLKGSGGISVEADYVWHQSLRTYTGDRYLKREKEDYADALANLLPVGPAWPREKDRILQKFVSGQAGVWGGTVEDAANLLLTKESDPRTTVAMLDWWERAWGLPDECVAEPLTITDRQAALVAKMTLMGGQSRAYFKKAAALLGYRVDIREFAPFMVGVSRAGDTSFLDDLGYYRWETGKPDMRFYWTIRMAATRYTWFRCSSGQAGVDHHLEFSRATDLECLLNRWKPAHTTLIFNYGSNPEAGPLPYGLQFNGTNNGIVLPDNGFRNYPFSFSGWFLTDRKGVICHFGSSNTWPPNSTNYENFLYVSDTGKLRGGWYPCMDMGESLASVTDLEWHHGVFTISATKVMNLYLDNVPQGSSPFTCGGSPETNQTYFMFGGGKTASWPGITGEPDYFSGAMADLRLYNRELIPGEVATLYNGGNVTNGLIGCYSLQDADNPAIDSSGFLRHGTVYGSPLTQVTGPLPGGAP